METARANAEVPMCDKCIELDRAIERFRQVQRTIMDQVTVDRAKEALTELEAKKAELHPDDLNSV